MSQSRKIKKSSSKYNQQIEQQKRIVIEYYKRNPVAFVERELEIKLHWWQKQLLKLAFKGGFKDE